MRNYVADFETITDNYALKKPHEITGKPLDVRVWLWGAMEIIDTEVMQTGTTIESFMTHIEKNQGMYYFHNLKFDGWFIVDWLLKNGFTYDDTRQDKTFRCHISDQRQWYSIEVVYKRTGRRLHRTEIRDSLKKLPFSVAKIGDDFDLGIKKIQWSQEDYTTYRPHNHIPTQEELAYLSHDLLVMKRALNAQFNQGLNKMTVSGDALDHFKVSIGGKKQFDYLFPQLSLAEDADIRQTYRGGYCYVTPLARGKDIGEGIVFDVNSLYPSVMYDRLLPVSDPLFFTGKYEGDPTYPLFIQKLVCEYELKEGYLPTIQMKSSSYSLSEYSTSSKGELETLTLTSIDLKLFFEHYDVTSVEYISGYKFQGKAGVFKRYIDKWMHMKNTEHGAKKALAKLMLNGLYGKFGTNPEQIKRIPVLDGEHVHLSKDEPEFKKTVYIPMASFITAYARELTIRTGQKVFDRLLYSDTDSIHLTGLDIPEAIQDIISKDVLGEWKLEYRFKRAKFLRPKRYIEEILNPKPFTQYRSNRPLHTYQSPYREQMTLQRYNGLMVIKCGGLNEKVKNSLGWDEFNIGFETDEALRPLVVSGGVALIPRKFKMRN